MAKTTLSKPQKKKLPDMSRWTDEQIAQFWETHDSTEYLDQMEEVEITPEVPSDFRVLSLRLDAEDIHAIKALARRKGVPYTVLLRMWVKERLAAEEQPKP